LAKTSDPRRNHRDVEIHRFEKHIRESLMQRGNHDQIECGHLLMDRRVEAVKLDEAGDRRLARQPSTVLFERSLSKDVQAKSLEVPEESDRLQEHIVPFDLVDPAD